MAPRHPGHGHGLRATVVVWHFPLTCLLHQRPQVIMEFNDVSSAAKARTAMHGRRFAGRVVNATYLTEEAYFSGRYDG